MAKTLENTKPAPTVNLPAGYLEDKLPVGYLGSEGLVAPPAIPCLPGYRVIPGRDDDSAKSIMRDELDLRLLPAGSGIVPDERIYTKYDLDGVTYLKRGNDLLWVETEAHHEDYLSKRNASWARAQENGPLSKAARKALEDKGGVLVDGPPPPPDFPTTESE